MSNEPVSCDGIEVQGISAIGNVRAPEERVLKAVPDATDEESVRGASLRALCDASFKERRNIRHDLFGSVRELAKDWTKIDGFFRLLDQYDTNAQQELNSVAQSAGYPDYLHWLAGEKAGGT